MYFLRVLYRQPFPFLSGSNVRLKSRSVIFLLWNISEHSGCMNHLGILVLDLFLNELLGLSFVSFSLLLCGGLELWLWLHLTKATPLPSASRVSDISNLVEVIEPIGDKCIYHFALQASNSIIKQGFSQCMQVEASTSPSSLLHRSNRTDSFHTHLPVKSSVPLITGQWL